MTTAIQSHAVVPPRQRNALRRLGGQGALLMGGFAAAQGCAFLRNALLGHWLSPANFGIAAAITLMLQLIEMTSDLGAERLLVQAPDGDRPTLQATAQATLVFRGLFTGLVLLAAAGPMAHFFDIAEAAWAFQAIAVAPVIKGFMHLDCRRYQRAFHNRPFVLVEILPQALALALTIPLLQRAPAYDVVVWLSLAQAFTAVFASHALSERPYRIALDRDDLVRLLRFGWPIWLSAFPLIAVYQGDRLIVGRLIGIEALGAYTAAFLVTMVPGLLAARVGNALMLPLLSEARSHSRVFNRRYDALVALFGCLAAAYLTAFVTAGEALLPLVFGPNFTGLAPVLAALALMWTFRIVQAAPGMALMAKGDTQPLLYAGLVRAIGLILAVAAVQAGGGLVGAALAAAIAEGASLLYVFARTTRHAAPRGHTLGRLLLLTFAVCVLCAIAMAAPSLGLGEMPLTRVALAALAAVAVAMLGLFVLPPVRQLTLALLPSS